jgi:hypothetical protein
MDNIDEQLQRHRDQIHAAERQIGDVAARIVSLLEEDFPAYLARETKVRFVNAPGFADAIPATTLAALKRDIEDEGKRAAADIGGALREPALWMTEIEPPDGAFELAHVPEVWRLVTRIDSVLEGLLAKYRFPSAGAAASRPQYTPPTWFVSGTLLKTLMETYRTHLRERARLRQAVDRLRTQQRAAQLESKWDATS